MSKIEPEIYNEFGEIVKREVQPHYERKLTTSDKHRIHETKDLYDSDCPLCQKAEERYQKLRQREKP